MYQVGGPAKMYWDPVLFFGRAKHLIHFYLSEMYWEIKCIGWSAKLAEANTLLQKPPGVHHHSPPAYEAPILWAPNTEYLPFTLEERLARRLYIIYFFS